LKIPENTTVIKNITTQIIIIIIIIIIAVRSYRKNLSFLRVIIYSVNLLSLYF